MSQDQIQVGKGEGAVKIRATHGDGGWVTQIMTSTQARTLASKLSQLCRQKDVVSMRIEDGKRWTNHDISAQNAQKIIGDLILCANEIDKAAGERLN